MYTSLILPPTIIIHSINYLPLMITDQNCHLGGTENNSTSTQSHPDEDGKDTTLATPLNFPQGWLSSPIKHQSSSQPDSQNNAWLKQPKGIDLNNEDQ